MGDRIDRICPPYPELVGDLGTVVQCICGRRYRLTHGDGMLTPPRPYWRQLRRLHLRRYRTHV